MSSVRFIGCLHLGHKNIAVHRGFQDEYYHDEKLVESWNSVVHKKDLVYILGDITMENHLEYYQLDRLKGRKIVVLGNHDRPEHVKYLLNYVESVAGMIDYKEYCLSHAPIHPCEMGRYFGNIHAHIHHINKLVECNVPSIYQDHDSILENTLYKYYNVDAKLIDFKPKTLVELKEIYGKEKES